METFIQLINIIASLFLMLILLRALLRFAQADFYNPITQAIVKITNPILDPVYSVLKSYRNIDIAALFLAFMLIVSMVYINTSLYKAGAPPLVSVLLVGVCSIFYSILGIYQIAIFLNVIVSWIAPHTYNPAAIMAQDITKPLVEPIRKMMPDTGGLDFSPMIALLVIFTIRSLIEEGVLRQAGSFVISI